MRDGGPLAISDGTPGNDTINGGASDEVLVGHGGADTLNGGGGNDTLYAGELSPPWSMPGSNYPYSYYIAPILDRGTDVDTLNGGAGIDLIFAGYGDKIDGGADAADLLISLAGASTGVTTDFRPLAAGGTLTIGGGLIQNIRSVLWIEGSNFDDTIIGSNQNADFSSTAGVIFGLDGNDHLTAGSSTYEIFGGEGNDTISSGYGGGTYYGDAGNDLIIVSDFSAFSPTTIYGGDGDDQIQVAGIASGGAGDDVITAMLSAKFGLTANGDEGSDNVSGGELADKLAGGDSSDIIAGGGGNDILMSDGTPDWLASWAGLDQWLDYGASYDQLFGGDGDDIIYAGFNDDVDGGNGNDSLILNLSVSSTGVTLKVADLETNNPYHLFSGTIQRVEHVTMLFATSGNDVITMSTGIPVYGMGGDDTINGSLLSDTIYGDEGNDTLNGSDGADDIHGGAGTDIIDGGAGNDTIHIDDVTDIEPGEQIRGGLDVDTLVVTFPQYGPWGDVSLAGVTLTGVEVLTSEQGKLGIVQSQLLDVTTLNGSFTFDAPGDIRLAGKTTPYSVDLTLNSGGNNLFLDGFIGATYVTGSDANDWIDGSASRDQVYGGGGNDTIGGRGGNDWLSGGPGNDWIDGHDGDDNLFGDEGSDHLNGGAGNDRLDGVENPYGPQPYESDKLIGGDGDDYISAGYGDDVEGGPGTDKLNYTAQGAALGLTLDFSQVASGGTYNIGGLLFTEIEQIVAISGTNFNDILVAGPLGASAQLDGGSGDDDLTGGSGANTLYGGYGDDILRGGLGSDTLAGGDGKDTFKDTAAGLNGDTIAELFTHDDKIVITDANLAGFTFNLSGNTLTYTGGSLTLNAIEHGHFTAIAAAGGGVELKLVQQPVRNNFNGSQGSFRASDVLWQNSNGTVRDWLGQGGFVGNIDKVNILTGPEWHVIGTGDFNGDGRADVLWKHDNGTVRDWLGQPDASFKGNIDKVNILSSPDWHAVGVGDFNGDGRDDVLWQNDNGTVREWLGQADGSFAGNIAHVNFVPAAGMHIVGTADFNGDGHADILWQSNSGVVTDWLGQDDGSFVDNSATVNINTGTSWHAVGTGDFNGDGMSDILWRNDNGTIREWLGHADGTFTGNTANVNFVPPAGQHVVGIGDYNGDAIDDLLWSNNGTITQSLGQTDGSFVDNSAHVNITTGTDWHVQDPFVHDLFG